jgi:LacI family transcriptional regulator
VTSRVTSRDIAREAGVSQSTVSRALRGDPRVAESTRQHIYEVARGRHYAPNLAARSLTTKRASTIAVVVTDIRNPFYPELVDVLHDEFQLGGYRMILLDESSDPHTEAGLTPLLHGGAVDGVAFISAMVASQAPTLLTGRGLPVVLLNREVLDVEADVDRVVSDNHSGGARAAEHLYDLGHRRIGFISGPSDTSTARLRTQGFCEALARLGCPLDGELRREGSYTHQGGYQWCMDLLELQRPPTAVFCGNDVIAFGALDAAKQRGVAVPDALSIVGYDDIEMSAWQTFALTTIRQPLPQMAKAAARLLVERIEAVERRPAERYVFPAGLVARATTAPPWER